MTRNYIVLFLFLLVVTTSLLVGITGPKGMVVNRELARVVQNEQHRLDVQSLKFSDLRRRLDSIWSEASLLDAARSMGYVQSDESVYFFFDEQGKPLYGQETTIPFVESAESDAVQRQGWNGLSCIWQVIISACVSLSIVLSIMLRRRRRTRTLTLTLDGGSAYADHHFKARD